MTTQTKVATRADEATEWRQDTGGVWHVVASAPCEECGCPYDYSLDEPGMVWEAGGSIDPVCLDDLCDCHIVPVQGLRFKINVPSDFARP